MKPIRLLMSAFGPYAQEQSIDFRELGRHRFFLIHGPTGSGKTTILDAICYALFGESSGSERDGEQMRSHLAAPSTPTFVEFDFAIGKRTFRARRHPRQQRLKKAGDGTTSDPAGATLWELAGDGEVAAVLAAQTGKVTAEVTRILGFGVEQFRQVILIPQDKFRDLLMADSTRREDILQTLFQTQVYEQLQDQLKERSRELRLRVEQANRDIELLLNQAAVKGLDELAAIRAARVNEAATLAVLVAELRKQEESAQRRLQAAVKDREKLDECNAAAAQVALLQTQTQSIDADRRSASAARRAASLAPHEAMLRERQQQEKARRDALQAAARMHADAADAHQKALAALSKWSARKPEREGLHAELVRLEGLRDPVSRIEQADREVADAQRVLVEATRSAEVSATLRENADKAVTAAADQLRQATEALSGLQSAELLYSSITRQVKDRQNLEDVRGVIREEARRQNQAEEKLERARTEIRDMKADLADLQRAYIEGHAAQLAGKLVDGEACPVCGSLAHPTPASSERPVPAWERVEERQRQVDRKEKEADSLAKAAGAITADLAGRRATELALIESLGDAGREPLAALIDKQQSARGHLEAATRASLRTPELEKALAAATARRNQATIAMEAHLRARQSAETQLAARRATRDAAVAGVPDSVRTLAKLEAARVAATGKLHDLDRAIESAEKAVQTAAAALHGAAEKKASAEAELQAAGRGLGQSNAEFAALREAAGFVSEQELAAAKLDETQVRCLEERIAAHEQAAGAARVRAQRAAAAAAGIQPSDLDALSLRVTDIKASLEANVTGKATVEESLKQIDRLIGSITKASEGLAALEAEYSIVGKVADVAAGNNGARLTFQRYVLSSMLDQVLDAASIRLRLMSSGRYHLRRKLVPADQRSHAGLDLEVFDAHTGVHRAAETLSGGESFLASLSLALGLADVVAQHAGSIRMETMFIDEGFGSLDAESLELAINTLAELMADGRIVGIISHVPELRERIDARLEIVSTRSGSIARFTSPAAASETGRVPATLFA